MYFSSSSYSHFYVGSMYDDIRLHVAWSYTSSLDSPFSLISPLTLFNHLLLGLPLLLLHPCTSISITLLPTLDCSYLHHFILLFWPFHQISPTFVVPLVISFLILSSFVTLHIQSDNSFFHQHLPIGLRISCVRKRIQLLLGLVLFFAMQRSLTSDDVIN